MNQPTPGLPINSEAIESAAAAMRTTKKQIYDALNNLFHDVFTTLPPPATGSDRQRPDAPLIRVKVATHCGDPNAIAPEGVLALRDQTTDGYNATDEALLTKYVDEITDWKPIRLLGAGLTFADIERLAGSRLVDRYGNVWIFEPPTRLAREAVIPLIDSVDSLRNHETEATEPAPGSVVGTWRKRPVTIEAAQLTGDTAHDLAIHQWIADNTLGPFEPLDVLEGRVPAPASGVAIDPSSGDLLISTLEGVMRARPGWWVIRGVEGEFYPCEPGIFAATYEKVN